MASNRAGGVLKILDKKVVWRGGVVNDELELVQQPAVGEGNQVAKEARVFLVAEDAEDRVVAFEVRAHAIQEPGQAFMREATGPQSAG
jgi:hypothetical protein